MANSTSDIEIIVSRVKNLLDMENTTLYDEKINILVDGAITKLELEGVGQISSTSSLFNLYCICISYYIAQALDPAYNVDTLSQMYMTGVVTLRQNHEQ